MKTRQCGCTTPTCGCCAGTQVLTPASTANRPGLDVLSYRVGRHATFLETMKARLGRMEVDGVGPDGQTPATFRPLQALTTRDSSDPSIALLDGWAMVADVLAFYQERLANEAYLRTATERRSVLELARLVGYALRPGVAASVYLAYTLDEKQTTPVEIAAGARSQSIPGPDELAQSFETSDPLLARAEWSNLLARRTKPQKITAQNIQTLHTIFLAGTDTGLKPGDPLVFEGFGAPVLRFVESVEADFANARTKVALLVAPAAPIAAEAVVELAQSKSGPRAASILRRLVKPLSVPPALPVARSSTSLPRSLNDSFGADSDVQAQLLGVFNPTIKPALYSAWASGARVEAAGIAVYGFGVKALPFGATAPLKPINDADGRVLGHEEWPIVDSREMTVQLRSVGFEVATRVVDIGVTLEGRTLGTQITDPSEATVMLGNVEVRTRTDGTSLDVAFTFADGTVHSMTIADLGNNAFQIKSGNFDVKVTTGQSVRDADASENRIEVVNPLIGTALQGLRVSLEALGSPDAKVVFLDAQYDQVLPNSTVLILRDGHDPLVSTVVDARTVAMADYGITGKSTRITLNDAWLGPQDRLLSAVRPANIFAQSAELALAEEPITADVGGDRIELDRLYDGLKSGRWIIVSGERTDIKTSDKAVEGVQASELVMISGVTQSYDPDLPGDKVHTTLMLANRLSYRYRRESLKIYANVVKATHGETRNETLGGGDGAKPLQAFSLKQPPLTFVSAETPSGVSSTLKVYVNDVEWHERGTLALLTPKDHAFVTQTGDDGVTRVIFGNGEQGARPPTGVENIKAVYRNGIGRPGNVAAGQITLLQTRPLGVKEVINPLRASGGADRESLDLARESAPLAVMALDRLVSVQDYTDFARTFAGIGKAAARRISNGEQELVHVTVAGADDIPIDRESDLFVNLGAALRTFGDPAVPVQLAVRELIVLVLSANVRLAPDYLWDPVAIRIRERLLDVFGFRKQALAQSVPLGQVIALIQRIEGVAYVDVDRFGGVPEKVPSADGSLRAPSQEDIRAALDDAGRIVRPFGLPNRRLPGGKKIKRPPPWVEAAPATVVKGAIRPAQLAIFVPDVPDTLILNQIG